MKAAIITGGNRGIGLAIVQKLLEEAPEFQKVCVTSTDFNKAKEVTDNFQAQFPAVQMIPGQLNLMEPSSVTSFVEMIQSTIGHFDVLINNAGMAYKNNRPLDEEVVVNTNRVNFFGTIELTDQLLPMVTPNGHIIFVSSQSGKLASIPSEEFRQRFLAPDLTRDQLFALEREFKEVVIQNTFEETGWKKSGYGISKTLLNGYVRILDRELRSQGSLVRVNALCPGSIKTDMSGAYGKHPPEVGARTPIFLVKDTSNATGKFWYESAESEW